MKLDYETAKAWERYVLAQYPNEACAFIVDGMLWPVQNLSPDPETRFSVNALDRLKAHKAGEVTAFLHSHPYKLEDSPFEWDPSWATSLDMDSWMNDNIPWGIVSTDGEGLSPIVWYDDSLEGMDPLEGREFVSGKNDCYSAIRDFYRSVLKIDIPNFSRGMGWWDRDQNLYEDNFEKAGFVEVSVNDIQVNDVLLMRMTGTVVSHSAVVVAENQIFHHVMRRLSGYDSLSKWHRQIVKAVRYVGVSA